MIDSMTDEAFKGNPTPVFILDGANQGFETQKWPRDHILQTVAREMDQSETIFVTRDSSDDESGGDAARWLVRSFTPYKEEVLCGHGLVGAAYLLGRSGGHAHGRRIRFRTVGGLLIDAQVDAREPSCGAEYGEAIQIQLELPAQPVKDWFSEDEELKREIARSLGVKMEQILALGRNALMDLVIELSCDVNFSAAGMKIDAVALMEACPLGTRSQILTSGGERYGVDFVKRVFAYGSEGKQTTSVPARRGEKELTFLFRSGDRLDVLCLDAILACEVVEVFDDREAGLGADGSCHCV